MEQLYIVIAAVDIATKLNTEEKEQLTNILMKINDNKRYKIEEVERGYKCLS